VIFTVEAGGIYSNHRALKRVNSGNCLLTCVTVVLREGSATDCRRSPIREVWLCR